MRKRLLKVISICAVGVMLCACGSEDMKNTIEEQEIIIEQVVEENKENNGVVFSRDLYRTIPEGYKEIEWRAYDNKDKKSYYLPGYYDWEMPENLFEDYTMVENEITGMRGLVNYDGDFLIDANYSDITYCWYENQIPFFEVEYEGEKYIVDIEGKKQDFELPYEINGGWLPMKGQNGHYAMNSIEPEGGYKGCIYNSNGEIVAGPYSQLVRLEDDVFYYHEYAKEMSEYAIDENCVNDVIGFFDSKDEINYLVDGALINFSDTFEDIIREEKTVIFRGTSFKTGKGFTSIINYENNTKRTIEGSCLKVYENRLIYESNDTYKYVDWDNQHIFEERYYGYAAVMDDFVLLKNEKGEWICLDENGQLLIDYGCFYGGGEQPDFYSDMPIVGYWEHEGVPCVVVENIEAGIQIGYSLK